MKKHLTNLSNIQQGDKIVYTKVSSWMTVVEVTDKSVIGNYSVYDSLGNVRTSERRARISHGTLNKELEKGICKLERA